MVEYSPEKKGIIGYPKRIWHGGTDRGCIEAPHLTKKNGYYYIMCAEGGTGYNNWLRMADGSNLAKVEVPESSLPAFKISVQNNVDNV